MDQVEIRLKIRRDLFNRLEQYLDRQEGGLTRTRVVEEALNNFLPPIETPIQQPQPKVKVALPQNLAKSKLQKDKARVKLPTPLKVSPSTFEFCSAGGVEVTNPQRTNEDRAAESTEIVAIAVENLKQQGGWDRLNVRGKIAAIKAETKKLRGAAVSTQTLYREHVKDIWNKG